MFFAFFGEPSLGSAMGGPGVGYSEWQFKTGF